MSQFKQQPETLLGADVRSQEVTDFLVGLDPKKKTKKEDGEYSWYSKEAGLSLKAHLDSGRITDVFFYAAGYDRCKQYAGTLPYGLRFDMTRDQMSQAVGSPGADNGEGLVWELPDFDLFAGENPKTNKLESFCVSGTF